MSKVRIAESGMVMFYCPGCKCHHGVHADKSTPNPLTGARWGWNGSVDSPTFTPSILVRGTIPITDEEIELISAGKPFTPVDFVCHSFVRDGRIQYLSDCTHEFAGQTIDLQDED